MRTYGFDVRGRPPRAWLLDEVGGVTTYRLSHTSSQQSWKAQAQLQGKTALIRFDGLAPVSESLQNRAKPQSFQGHQG